MCGLAGALDRDGRIAEEDMRRRVERMIAPIVHRGPDAHDVVALDKIGLGHRRLAILDLNERANQPMADADESVWIVFNGEIYNFMALREELMGAGHDFHTTSDTEVLVIGWKHWGEDLFPRLAGMFALAIWDVHRQELILARDRFGKKPLFFCDLGNEVLFASEIKSMLNWPSFSKEVDYTAIHDYLSFHYIIGQESAFKGVRKVAPATFVRIGRDGSVSERRYWTLAAVDASRANASADELCEEFFHYFDQAIGRRLVSDVPVGAFLSGGVDSSAVVARMAPLLDHPLKTFSVGFAEDGYDETPYAHEVASRYGTEHHEFYMGPELIDDLPRIIWHYGEPYADSSALVTFALSRKIREHVKVALTGDGGDEIFLGYQRYIKFLDATEAWHENGAPALRQDWESPLAKPTLLRDMYARSLNCFRDMEKLQGYGPAMLEHLSIASCDNLGTALESADSTNAIDLAARCDVATYLEGDLNVKADIATMAASLEGRAPFLDHDLADWAMSLPQQLRVFERNGKLESKALLKRALEPYLSEDLLYRKKQGFSVPVRHWLRAELHDFAYETLTSKRFIGRGLFTRPFVERLFDQHQSRYQDQGTRLWAMLSMEMWFQTFIDSDANVPLDVGLSFGRAEKAALAA